MTQQHPIVRHGKFLLPSVICLFLFLAMFVILGYMRRNLQIFHQIYHDLAEYHQAGLLLRQGSDILTDAVRKYSITGDLSDRERYFKEVNVDRHRERAFAILDTLPGGDAVNKNLAIAMKNSKELQDLEYHAMRLLATPEDLDISKSPEPIINYVLNDFELRATAEECRDKAQQLLFSSQYEHHKTQIYYFIDSSFEDATSILDNHFSKAVAQQKCLYLLLALDMLALLAAILVLLYLRHVHRTRADVLLRNLLDNIPLLFRVKNARTETYLDANDAFLQFAGKQQLDEILGKTDDDIFDEHTAKNLIDNDIKTLLSRAPVTLQDTLTDAAGIQHRYRITQFVVEDGGNGPCVIGMADDVTEGEEAAANAHALAKLLFCLQDDASVVVPSQLLQIIRERADADYALLVRYDQEGRCYIETDCGINRNHAPLPQPVSCLTSDIPQILREIQCQQCYSFSEEDLATLHAACVKHGNGHTALPECATMVAFPIFVHHELWGNLTLCYSMRHKLSKFEREFGTECCEVLAVCIERRVNYRALQDALANAAAPK